MQARGIFLTVLSAVLYGLNPLFSKTINVGGCNSLTQTFARLAAGIVIFFILLVCSGSGSVREKLRLSRQELKDILICCIGYGLIGPLLFASYNYLASALPPRCTSSIPCWWSSPGIAFRYERANRRKLVCCALCFAGILCFYTPGGDVSAYGVFLALASGVAWAYYIVHLNSSGLVTMAPFKLGYWLCVFSAALVGGITLAMGEFVWPSTAFTRGALALYCCVSTAASLLFQLGNRFIGAQSASMLSTFEPLTSVVIGILVYHEVLIPCGWASAFSASCWRSFCWPRPTERSRKKRKARRDTPRFFFSFSQLFRQRRVLAHRADLFAQAHQVLEGVGPRRGIAQQRCGVVHRHELKAALFHPLPCSRVILKSSRIRRIAAMRPRQTISFGRSSVTCSRR